MTDLLNAELEDESGTTRKLTRDWDNAVQAHTSTVRGWEKLPVRT